MSGGEVRHLSGEHLQVVQNLIERCIQLHMSKMEAVTVLSRNANVVPGITELVWQRLEEENRDFFQFYYIRLALKEQINRFNELLKKQAALMEQIQSAGVPPLSGPNGSRMTQFQQSASRYPIDHTGPSSQQPENLQSAIPPSLPTSFANGVPSFQTHPAYDMPNQSRRVDFLPDTLQGQSSNPMRLVERLNGGIIKSESGFPSDSQIIFDDDTGIGEPPGPLDDSSFSAMDSLLNGACSSFGQLGQLPKIFSFPDLAAFPHALDNYQHSAFITTDTDNYLDRSEIQDESKGAISESYNTYEDFGSD